MRYGRNGPELILHRKNALFYKTENGARVGDAFMSLIHTAELNGIAPFDYPGAWLPWNYQETLAALDAQTASSP